MKSFLKFLATVLVIILVASTLAPILYQFLDFKFEKIFNRIIMIEVLLAIVLLVRANRKSMEGYGLKWTGAQSLREFATTFVIAVVILGVLSVLKIYLGHGEWSIRDQSFLKFLGKTVSVTIAALLIGVIEEYFFRGFIYTSLKKRFKLNLVISLVLACVFYSLLHFVNYQKPFIGPEPNFFDSLKLVTAPIHNMRYFPQFWPAAAGLFLLGLILNLLYIRTGSLYPSIGLHAGCVFFVKMDGDFINFNSQNPLFYTSDKMYDGVLGWIFLIIIMGLSLRLCKKAETKVNP